MPIDLIPEPWRTFFVEIDAALTEETEFHCIGGFVVTMLYGFARSTVDVDVFLVRPRDPGLGLSDLAGRGSSLHKRHGIYLDLVTIAKVPENYEERLVEIFAGTFKRLRIFGVDPYDLALSKIERNIERDRNDVKYLSRTVPLNLEKLQRRYSEELRPDLFVPEREDLTLKLWIEMIEESE